MNSYTSFFSLYEILRIVFPGFYFNILLLSINDQYKWWIINTDTAAFYFLFSLYSIVIGGLIYSIDIPKYLSFLFPSLPTKRMQIDEEFKSKNGEERSFLFFDYYAGLEDKYKVKIEIQSGFLHLFINLTAIGIIGVFTCCVISGANFILKINTYFTVLLIISIFVIYHRKLKLSWERVYKKFKSDSSKANSIK